MVLDKEIINSSLESDFDFDRDMLFNEEDFDLSSPLPSDLDIFSDIDQVYYKNTKIAEFLKCFKKTISSSLDVLREKTLAKLTIEPIEDFVQVSWIFNYFRAYFCFRTNDVDTYGIVAKKPNEPFFTNVFRPLPIDKYAQVTRFVLEQISLYIDGGEDF